jgi:hypothetical protein
MKTLALPDILIACAMTMIYAESAEQIQTS